MRKVQPIYVLGTGLSHDGSACLLKDGKIAVAIEKERITRVKHDGRNDDRAIEYCLRAENIRLEDVALIVQCGGGRLYYEQYHFLRESPDGNRLVSESNEGVPVVTLSHHLAHAYNAVGTSPFDEMAVLVIDGSGQEMNHCQDLEGAILPELLLGKYAHLCFEKDSFYSYKDGRLSCLYKDFSPFTELWLDVTMFPRHMAHSIGDMYEQASLYCLGVGRADSGAQQAGKLMGLAPYGRPGVFSQKIFDLQDGRVFIKYDWQHAFDRPCHGHAEFQANFQYYADIAYWVQKEAEEAILYIINQRAGLCPSKNLAYTGGVALNAVANAKIIRQTPFERLYMTPAAGDNGLAIGCAYYGWLEVLKKERVFHDGNSCFGRKYSEAEIGETIEKYRPLLAEGQVRETIDSLFTGLRGPLEGQAAKNLSCRVSFIIKDVNIFGVEFGNGRCRTGIGAIDRPGLTLIADGLSLAGWVMGTSTLECLSKQGKFNLEGQIEPSDIAIIRDILMEKMYMTLIRGMKDVKVLRCVCEAEVISATADLLAEGKVIGWFQDGSEFGPRALGHRSILADPRRKDVRQFINSNIKLREDFRPFAPSVLLEDVSRFFQYESESPYMIMVAQVRPEWKEVIPAVVHEDESCRIQTVTPEWNGKYHALLLKFRELTGVGILLNTSFNNRGMPIVETPLEALNLFYESDLDSLVIGNYVVERTRDHVPETAGAQNSVCTPH